MSPSGSPGYPTPLSGSPPRWGFHMKAPVPVREVVAAFVVVCGRRLGGVGVCLAGVLVGVCVCGRVFDVECGVGCDVS